MKSKISVVKASFMIMLIMKVKYIKYYFSYNLIFIFKIKILSSAKIIMIIQITSLKKNNMKNLLQPFSSGIES